MSKERKNKEEFNIINVKADMHPDGDIYVYNRKTKKYHYIGIVITDLRHHLVKDNEIITSPVPNPAYTKIKKLLNDKKK